VIPRTVLVIASRFSGGLSAARVASAIARGIRSAPAAFETELCLLEHVGALEERSAVTDRCEISERAGFDTRVHLARAVVLARPRLLHDALGRGTTFEIATRARQGGVPAYAITTPGMLDLFQARMFDLQVILQASSERALLSAGRELGELM
jgi:hypothetical protein